ncbi:MAG: tryptophan-rich sensory protein [Candidatus Colwellbacteria bacterium]|nr:tryptophan-rich sensory protein [Candidatus Colwellbacteria bacterium]
MKVNSFLKLLIAISISEFAGIVGSFFTVSAVPNWYAALEKPVLNPPSWIFGPVWIILYALMGVAVFLVWEKGWKKREVKKALGVFGIQLFLNAIWSIVFFGLQNPFWALINIAFLWLAIIWTIFKFYPLSKPASYLLAPYILWVSFAVYLNYAIWALN